MLPSPQASAGEIKTERFGGLLAVIPADSIPPNIALVTDDTARPGRRPSRPCDLDYTGDALLQLKRGDRP